MVVLVVCHIIIVAWSDIFCTWLLLFRAIISSFSVTRIKIQDLYVKCRVTLFDLIETGTEGNKATPSNFGSLHHLRDVYENVVVVSAVWFDKSISLVGKPLHNISFFQWRRTNMVISSIPANCIQIEVPHESIMRVTSGAYADSRQ